MSSRGGVTREDLMLALAKDLDKLGFVKALYEGGAAAFGRVDEWSDVDLYVLVDDGKAEDAFRAVERSMESLSPISLKYNIGATQWKGVSQAFYRLRDASEFLIVDLAVIEMSADEKFLEPTMHGDPVFHLRKLETIPTPSLDRAAFTASLALRLDRLEARMDMFLPFIYKELNRGHSIEAVDLYRGLVLDSLVEVLRMKHVPIHHSFKTRYVHEELPVDAVARLQALAFVADIADLKSRLGSAVEWFNTTVAEIREIGLDRLPL